MVTRFTNIIEELKKLDHVEKKVLEQLVQRVSQKRLTQSENPSDHICSFFLPIDLKTGSLYLVDHIKAQSWIPPGGHMEKTETPVDTVRREFYEELGFILDKETIKLFDISISPITNNPDRLCRIHYDLWYLVFIDRQDFTFDKREFNAASWFTFRSAIQKIQIKQYKKIIKKVSQNFSAIITSC